MLTELRAQRLGDQTAIIISAKHGQSPQDPEALTRIDDGPIINGINEAWAKTHPRDPPLVASGTDDDAFMQWLSDRSRAGRGLRQGLPVDPHGDRQRRSPGRRGRCCTRA